MRRFIAYLLCLALTITGLGFAEGEADYEDFGFEVEEPEFISLSDPELMQYIEDSTYAYLENNFGSDDYVVESVNAIYISQEYLDEVAYNTKANVYFGFTLSDLNEMFEGERYVFTCDDKGQTIATEFQEFPDTTNKQILTNIAIGTGVILVCVVVTVATAGSGAGAAAVGGTKAISLIFAAAAEGAAKAAITGAVISGVTTAVATGDIYEAGLAASEGFKWGAIGGAVAGGAGKAFDIVGKSNSLLKDVADEAVDLVLEGFEGRTEVSYFDGQEVPYGQAGSAKPDVVRYVDDHWEAVEIKSYSLSGAENLISLKNVVERQVTERMANLPEGMTQRIVLDVNGRGYERGYVESVVSWLQNELEPIYPDIPIDYIGEVL